MSRLRCGAFRKRQANRHMLQMPFADFCLKRLEQLGLVSQHLRRRPVGDKRYSMPFALNLRQNT